VTSICIKCRPRACEFKESIKAATKSKEQCQEEGAVEEEKS
jgi:hypothetical protein